MAKEPMRLIRIHFRLVLLTLIIWVLLGMPRALNVEAAMKASATAAAPATKSAQSRVPAKPPRQQLMLGYIGLVFIIFVLTGLILQVTLMVALRRAVLPQPDAKKTITPYVDAWALAGKRVSDKPPDDVVP